MNNTIGADSNRSKQKSGQKLKELLNSKFAELKKEGVILNFLSEVNFSHKKFSYKKQYLANFIIETLDNKFIIIDASNSFRHDRLKQQFYNITGVIENSDMSENIIASIILYPDKEVTANGFKANRERIANKEAHSSASHIFLLSEFLLFLENHKISVQLAEEEEREAQKIDTAVVKDGSYFGKRGNQFEKEIVALLNRSELLSEFIKQSRSSNNTFNSIINKICIADKIDKKSIIKIKATNTVLKLASGGNAKTDIILKIHTLEDEYIETISVKNTTQSKVSCHDYTYRDFVRVLNCENSMLETYLSLFQQHGSHKALEENLPAGASLEEFTDLLSDEARKLTEWALTGAHDNLNIINSETQISKYILISKNNKISFNDMNSYIDMIFATTKLSYGVPFSWTYPSKNRGKRIQLKMPVLTD